MLQIKTDFPYLGTRRYIHGTSILNFILAYTDEEIKGAVKLKTIRFQNEINSNGSFYISENNDIKDLLQKADCYISFEAGNYAWKAVYIEEGIKVDRIVPEIAYSIENLTSDNNYGGSCFIKAFSRSELVCNIIQANKRMHLSCLPESQQVSDVRFGYMEKWDVPPKDIMLQTSLDIRNLITRNNINDIMTINRVTYSNSSKYTSLILCFKTVLKEKNNK
ncbi:MAG: hypothetical protein KJ607_04655 [Bacteroidetes bacterium]|nr:hypothetical protein [Bacteroidota bacterium]